jgi:hypothetical protein
MTDERCHGTGMISYQSGSDTLGEMCPGCDDCEPCLPDGTPIYPRRKLTREERLQHQADAGNDTLDWEER